MSVMLVHVKCGECECYGFALLNIKLYRFVKIFKRPSYKGDSVKFFSGFEVSFVTWKSFWMSDSHEPNLWSLCMLLLFMCVLSTH